MTDSQYYDQRKSFSQHIENHESIRYNVKPSEILMIEQRNQSTNKNEKFLDHICVKQMEYDNSVTKPELLVH